MPRVTVQAVEGRSAEQKRSLITGITDAVVTAYGVEPRAVTVVIEDIPATNFAKAGVIWSER